MRVAVLAGPATDAMFYRTDPNALIQGEATLEAVSSALRKIGYSVAVVRAGPGMLQELGESGADVVFNIATGYRSKRDQVNIAATLEFTGIPFTGSGPVAHALGLYKHLAKMVWQSMEIPTPRFDLVFDGSKTHLRRDLRAPLIVKPSSEGSSVGITGDSVKRNAEDALDLALELLKEFEPPVLVEEYVEGREFTVAIVGYPEPNVLPVEEILFREGSVYTYSVKSRDSVIPVCPADLPVDLALRIADVAKRAFLSLGCRDLGRVDIRLSREGIPYVLEVNTLPGLQPGYSEVPRIAEKAGMDYVSLVETILGCALARKERR